jgi:hypothetical protein
MRCRKHNLGLSKELNPNTVITVLAALHDERRVEVIDDRVADLPRFFNPMMIRRAATLSRKEITMKRVEPERPNRLSHLPGNQQEQIRLRAFEIYQQRGRQDGYELEDWLQAESEVLDNQRTPKAA